TPLENLKVCPANPSKDLPHQSVTIGDIHGNALRLIYQLIQAGVFESNHEYYQDLVTAYNALLSAPEEKSSEEEFSPEENNFLNVMNKFKICENPPFIRLIGDIFQDRGASDRMTNKVLEKLITEEVPYSINFSNHDMDFMIDYTNKQYNEKKDKSLSSNVFYKKPMTLLERDLFQSTWLKKLKLFDYEISEDGKQFYFFTHAPVGLETLKKISAQYGVEFNDESFSSLAKTIDSVNKKFQEEVTNEESRIRFIERIKKNKVFGSDDYHQDPIWQL